jgi:sulfite oxidase
VSRDPQHRPAGQMHDPQPADTQPVTSRRQWLRASLGAVTGAAALSWDRTSRAWPDPPGAGSENELIVRSMRPLDLESPRSALKTWRTPNELFFVRSHLGEPAVSRNTWRLELAGLVEKPVSMSLDDLKAMEQVTVPAVLQCSGNGRAFFVPRPAGAHWEFGAVGNAEWTGVRLADLLRRAGVKTDARHLHFLGADAPPNPKTPQYLRSLPLEKALAPSTIVALTMNGEALPWLHGGPMRLVGPGWTGNHWMKWLRTITAARDEAPGFYQQTGYKIARTPAPPTAVLKPEDVVSLTAMNVKSLIAWPAPAQRLPRGRHTIQGVAWTGEGFITKVEVAIGQPNAWRPATLLNDERPNTWRIWQLDWNATTPGRFALRVRATDSKGQTQPDQTPWNKSGYLWNSVEQVSCEIV